jgi:arylsulfatase A-like enzyme
MILRPSARTLLPALLLISIGAQAAAPRSPDLLLIVVESLRADHVGCYGCAWPTTPAIDALASNATRFAQASASSSWTQPSIATLLTSVSPVRHGMVKPRQSGDASLPTLAESLRKAGYQTVGIVANPMLHRRFGFAHGFDHYDDYTVAMAPGSADEALIASSAQSATSATVTRLALSWLERRDPARPLFLFLFYMDPHSDYLPPPPYDRLFTDDPIPPLRNIPGLGTSFVPPAARERIRAAYAGEIRYTDACIGRLLDALAATPRAGDTAVALCGDHGEAFWEHGRPGHGHHLYEEEIRVPLIIRAPGPSSGAIVTGQAGLIDLAPTLLALAGLPSPAGWEGSDLSAFLAGGALPERPLLLDTRVSRPLRAIRTPTLKLIALPPYEAPAEIYDLAADPCETNNLAGAAPLPSGVAGLLTLLRPATGEAPASKPIALDPATLRQIRSLGYAR